MKLEGTPTQDQRARLDQWLSDLLKVCRRWNIVPSTLDGELNLIDLGSDTIIGVGVIPLMNDHGIITALDCMGSVLDGVWLVDGPEGLVEQRELWDEVREPG